MSNKTLVPDKLQGYLLQVKHMLYELISVDDRVVSVEKFDDVAIEVDNRITAVQLKSVTSSNNPIADRSTVFWKTLYNWCTYIEEGLVPSDTIFRFVVVANKTIEPGTIQESFTNAHTEEEAKQALETARTTLLGSSSGDQYTSLPESYRDYVQYIFDDSRTTIVCGIIKTMEFEIHNDSYDNDLQNKFCKQPIPTEYFDVLLTYMLGWVTEKVESFTKDNKPAYISAKEYRDVLTAQVRARNVATILTAVSEAPSNIETGGEVARLDTYIKQLNLIEADEAILFEAASDFLRVKIEKVEWARRGIVTDQSFGDYHYALYRMWANQKRILEMSYTSEPLKLGMAIYLKCQEASMNQKLQGVETPSFFGSGSLQGLANTPADKPRIGWHPDYIELLKKGDEKND